MKAIKTTFLGATNTKGSRIKASDCDRNSVTLSWDHALDADENHKAAAKALCDKMDWKGQTVMGGFPDCNVHVFKTSLAKGNVVKKTVFGKVSCS